MLFCRCLRSEDGWGGKGKKMCLYSEFCVAVVWCKMSKYHDKAVFS